MKRFRSFPFAFFALIAALLGGACSDAVAQPPSGAYFVRYNGRSTNGGSCSNGGRVDGQVGDVDQNEFTDIRQNGEGFVRIECVVADNNDGTFEVDAFMILDPPPAELAPLGLFGSELRVRIDNMSPSATEAEPSLGRVEFTAGGDVNLGFFQSPPDSPCQFFLEGAEEVRAGVAWISFVCPVITSDDDSCELLKSVFTVQNCIQE